MTQDVTRREPVQPLMDPPPVAPYANHGRTVAGWALFWIVAAGAIVIAIGAVSDHWGVIFGGAVVIAVGLIVSLVLRGLGHGQPKTSRPVPSLTDPLTGPVPDVR
ncbi:hypothetical protein GCG21_07860 [Pseudactinotalea sp. HY160]|uniref:HGxxPAAW family protein n=1 Tax=Pseudactinotalea sp. HY160 TaxID=2654490 RepID=UPI00128D1B89|nr:HGxxPAAW family protein [Pseudactinotalea sp. HY160]MPV49920.1 hypothetical protein [Pseudactinotalea sp. HY160]